MLHAADSQDRLNDFVIKLANVNGTGSASANTLLMKSIFRMGIPVMGKNYFPSNIQGLPTWYEIRVTRDGYVARSGRVDIMVAMNAETYARDVKEVSSGGYLVYDTTWPRPALLKRDDITILGAPFVTFPLEDRRKSGLLTPYYAQTTTRGFEFGVPWYWNIAPERDLVLTPVYMAKRGVQLRNHFRYLDRPYAGELRLELLPEDREFGDSRTGVSWQHTHSLYPGLSAQIDYNKVSDDFYFVDLASQVKQVSVTNLPQDAVLTYNGSFGSAPYSLQARLNRFQTLQDPLAVIVPPYARMPQINFSTSGYDLGGFADVTAAAEHVR